VALWTGLIFVLGADTFSSSDTRGWLRSLIFRFIPDLSDADLDAFEFVARKGMHLALYFGLGALAFRAFRLQLPGALASRVAAWALALALAVAAADETRQAFLPRRSGAFGDVAIDGAGAAAGTLLLAVASRRRSAPD
jgi:VanZ family protein